MVALRGVFKVSILGLVLASTLLPARAVTIVSETGRDSRGWSARTDIFGIVSWTQTNGYQDVDIDVRLYSVALADKGTAYLMTRVGPGTTPADQVAVTPVAFPAGFNPSTVRIFSGLTLGPGTYYLIVAGGTNYWSAWYGTDQPTITTDAGVTHMGDVYAYDPPAYPPASVYHEHDEMHYIFSVTGNRIGENRPPVADAGLDHYLGCSRNSVLLDGRASRDPDGEPLTYTWWQGDTQVGAGSILSLDLSTGSHSFLLVVTDTSGASAQDTVWIIIEDTTPPLIEASVSLSPAKGKMLSVVIQAEVLDACDPFATARIIAVDSDDSNGRSEDWEITGPLTLNLRPRGLGRTRAKTYYVTVEASDASGNAARTTVPIRVP